MKPILQCIVLVDDGKPLHLRHSTAGRYRVGAKTGKEAVALVRKAIGFGSPKLFYVEDKENYADCFPKYVCKYKEIVRETKRGIEPVYYANSPADGRK